MSLASGYRGWRSLSRIFMPGKPEQLLRRSTQLEGSQGSQACGQGRLWSGVATHPFRWGPQRLGKWLCEQCLTLFLANSATPYTSPLLTPTDHIFCPPPPKKQPRCHTPSTSGLSDTTHGSGPEGGRGILSLGIRAGTSAEHNHKHPSSLPLSQP